jgi:WD40 repeat protein
LTSYYNDLDHLSFHPTLPILMAANNSFIRFWNPATGELLQMLENTSFDAPWSADGRLLVTFATDRKSVQIWEVV